MNAYERAREERIARNRAVLERLIASDPAHAALRAASSSSTTRRVRDSNVSTKTTKTPRRAVDASDVRRSGRVRKLPAPVYTTFDVDDDLGDANAKRKRAKRNAPRAETRGTTTTSSAARKPSAPASANSLRALDARLWDVYVNYLGLPIPPPPNDGGLKAAVVRALSPVANPKFSKMSGIQEWKNCVALYVNVGDKHGNTYDNVFSRAGSRISWFAQPRQDADTPVIRAIAKTATMDAESVEDARRRAEEGEDAAPRYLDWPLHLFCRMEGCEYVYCGRLKMVDFEPNKRPMKFTMQLLDASLLRGSEHFLGLLEI